MDGALKVRRELDRELQQLLPQSLSRLVGRLLGRLVSGTRRDQVRVVSFESPEMSATPRMLRALATRDREEPRRGVVGHPRPQDLIHELVVESITQLRMELRAHARSPQRSADERFRVCGKRRFFAPTDLAVA